MALVTCRECGKNVSDQAISCPYCGVQINKSEGMKIANKIAWLIIVGGILMMLLRWCSFYQLK